MIVTSSLIERIKTPNGGFTKKQIEVLGLTWPVQKGWKDLVVGSTINNWRVLFYERDKYYPPGFSYNLNKEITTRVVLDKTFTDTWKTRSEKLKIGYKDFLSSEHWATTKIKAKSNPSTYGKCLFCGANHGIELHHTSYKWVNTKNELRSIVPLCRTHHQEVHDYSKENNVSVRVATNKLRSNYKK